MFCILQSGSNLSETLRPRFTATGETTCESVNAIDTSIIHCLKGASEGPQKKNPMPEVIRDRLPGKPRADRCAARERQRTAPKKSSFPLKAFQALPITRASVAPISAGETTT
jgi:hypothetical protein